MPSPAKNTYYLGMFLGCFLLFEMSALGQTNVDSTHLRKHYRYSSITLFSGAEMQFFGRRPGILSVSFPYSVTDSSGSTTDHVFSGENKDIYGSHKAYVLPIFIELGHLHHFVHFGLAFTVNQGGFTGLPYLTAGYGGLWYIDPWRRGRPFNNKRWVIKASLNLTYTADGPNSNSAVLGSIDNYNKTVDLLGEVAGPTFTTGGGTGRGSTPRKTYIVQTLRVSYSQRELSLLPRISVALNPYSEYVRWELIAGYSIPVIERGGLYFQQVAAGQSKGISSAVNINNSDISASYDHQTIRSTPYHFGGLFVGVLFGFGKFKEVTR
jgi:hypothetical protein